MTLAHRTSHLARIALLVAAFAPTLQAQTYPSANDPRNGLKPGVHDAGI